jgi:ferredoxin
VDDVREMTIAGLTVQIDRTLCVGFEDCLAEAPEAFLLDDEGIAVFQEDAASTSRERIMAACDSCPVDALTAFDENGEQLIP